MRLFASIGLVTLLLAGGCRTSTELLLVISTDLVLPTEADTLQLDVERAGDGSLLFSQAYALTAQSSLPASLDLHGSRSSPIVAIHAQLLRGGIMRVERRVTVPFEPGRALELRLPLERSCLLSTCMGEATCLNGVCIPVAVDPSQLPPIGHDPLAPLEAIDMRPPSDLGVVPDLAQGTDMACAIPDKPPMSDVARCKQFVFDHGRPPGLHIESSSNIMYDFQCGFLNVHVPKGTPVVHNDFRVSIEGESTAGYASPFRIVARYDAVVAGVSWVGPEARANDFYLRGDTRSPAGGRDRLYLVDNLNAGMTETVDGWGINSSLGSHLVELDSVDTGAGTLYTYTVTGSDPITAMPVFPAAVTRYFVIGNDASGSGVANPIDVQLHYVEFCSNGP
ncbi:MAG: hypothetical protein ABI321_15840 [Polyangia bacterium]